MAGGRDVSVREERMARSMRLEGSRASVGRREVLRFLMSATPTMMGVRGGGGDMVRMRYDYLLLNRKLSA